MVLLPDGGSLVFLNIVLGRSATAPDRLPPLGRPSLLDRRASGAELTSHVTQTQRGTPAREPLWRVKALLTSSTVRSVNELATRGLSRCSLIPTAQPAR